MEKSTLGGQSTQKTETGNTQFLAHLAVVSFAVLGLVLNLFSGLWGGVRQLGSVPGRLVVWTRDKIADAGSSLWQQRESNS